MQLIVIDGARQPERVLTLVEQARAMRGSWDLGSFVLAPVETLRFWLWPDGQILAYARFHETDKDDLCVFEVDSSYRGEGYGSQIIHEMKQEKPGLQLWGACESRAAARFWRRMGLEPGELV
ncbi:MAG TPA: GNAT family N-acetyltransferase [Ktedonobacteraceae bacterium]|nr:GNAT family N-acetyltransferase [Ktedonobacteraceae bacterium]